jgi:ribosomal protein S18 acetylase RimI-like enzyme
MIKDITNYDEFKKVFLVFREEPFLEKWSEEKIHKEFLNLKINGEVFGYYLNDENIAGIITFKYGAEKDHPVKFKNPERIIYLSDIAVIKEQRGNGYAQALTDFTLDFIESFNYYSEVYFRTNYEGSMSRRMMESRGFSVMKNSEGDIITQDITFERTRDYPISDKRLFLSKRLGLK